MEITNANALIAKCRTDAATIEKIKAAGFDGFAALAEEMDLPCSLDELREALAALSPSSSELPDQQLSDLSSGKISQSDVPDNMMSLLTALKATAS